MTFLGWLSDPFKGLSDLQLGDEKGTLNHLVGRPCKKPTEKNGIFQLEAKLKKRGGKRRVASPVPVGAFGTESPRGG